MKKKLLFACFAAAGLFSASAALAAPTWIDDDVFSIDVAPTVVKTSTLSLSTSNALISEGNLKPNQRLFTINVSTEAGTKIALAGMGDSYIYSNGNVYAETGSSRTISGYIPSEYVSGLTADRDFFPVGSNIFNNSDVSALLLTGKDTYNIDVTTPPDLAEKYNMAGTYTFEFIAQAYTE